METATAPAHSLENEELDTPATLAKAVRTTPQTINAWHRAGILPARVAIGRIIRFDRREALAALAAHSLKPASEAAAAGAGQ